jgi:hypothetical protein
MGLSGISSLTHGEKGAMQGSEAFITHAPSNSNFL